MSLLNEYISRKMGSKSQMRQLYAHRIKADYELVEINQNIVENMIKTVDDLINTVLSKGRHGT